MPLISDRLLTGTKSEHMIADRGQEAMRRNVTWGGNARLDFQRTNTRKRLKTQETARGPLL